jgi:CHASE2 domain-containing sensor protein
MLNSLMLKKILALPSIQIACLTALILVSMLRPLGPWAPLENKNFDFWTKYFRSPGDQPIAIIAIDDKSLDQLGDWPWPRSRVAQMVRLVSSHGAEVLGLSLLYTQPDRNPGLQEIKNLKEQVSDPEWPGGRKAGMIVNKLLSQAEDRLDQDAQLINAVRRARNVVLPVWLSTHTNQALDNDKLSGLVIVNSLNVKELPPEENARPMDLSGAMGDGLQGPLAARGIRETFDDLAGKAGALGHLNLVQDSDGVVRRLPLLIDFQGRLVPAFALQLALKSINASMRQVSLGRDFFGRPHLSIRHLQLSTDEAYRMLIDYDRRWTDQRTFSFAQVLDGTIDPSVFRHQIVLIGLTAEEVTPTFRVGSQSGVSPVEISANALGRILSTARLSRPSWALSLEVVAVLYFAFFLIFMIPRVSIKMGATILAVFLLTWYAVVVGLLLGYGFWIRLGGPVLMACAGFVLLQASLYSRKWQQEKLEANKTLGLSYQGQGMLDMAYEKYMQCPVQDTSVKNLLYTLGLDFERKRMFNKALAVYDHILTVGSFKDVAKRSSRLRPLDSTLALNVGGTMVESPLMMDDTQVKPTFGRYELVRKLGRGSMGTIYLGRDPKINRDVAIKTLAYEDIDAGQLTDVKARFFREAEAAGKLSHPNIVAVYDVGEEHDMAYIAMELLSGDDLTLYCKPDGLLPADRVTAIIADVASALDYAHSQGVIHRDIKPANIMLLEDGRVNVTDFGIAQVVDASKTSSGIVLGTPNYMSPEQVAGKSLDGRSDLFSLGVVYYELLAGAKPFKGDTLNAILHAISRQAHTPLSQVVPDIPACCEAIINKLLAKGVSRRYKSAALVTKALEECMQELLICEKNAEGDEAHGDVRTDA